MLVPFTDLKIVNDSIHSQLIDAIDQTLLSSSFITGPSVQALEDKLSKFLNTEDCAAVGSGTNALVLALRACGIGPGDHVITTPLTFISTTEAIVSVGAVPIFVDIDQYYQIDINQIESNITKQTKAILAVDLYGQSADKKAISNIAKKYGLYYINDCAHSFGSDTADIADLSCFSFNPLKNLGAIGDAGAVAGSKALIEKVKSLSNHGRDSSRAFIDLGYNARIDNIQANIISAKLPHINDWNKQRQTIADRYDSMLNGVLTPKRTGFSKHVYYVYVIATEKRDSLSKHLNAAGIQTNIHYPFLCSKVPVFEKYFRQTPYAIEIQSKILSLPCYPGLTELKQNYVINKINEWSLNEL